MLAFAPGSFPASPEGWLDLLVVLSLKATAVLLLTAALTAILARASAASRHLAWSIGLVSLLALPPLAFWAPGFEVRGLAWPHSDDGAGLAIASSSAEAGSRVAKEPVTESPRTMDGGPVVRWDASRAAESSVAPPPSPISKPPFRPRAALWILGFWLAGFVAMTGWLAIGLLALARLSRVASPVVDPRVKALFDRCRVDLGLRRAVELWGSASAPVPCTWGFMKARVLVPAAAIEWPAERLRAVLLHELAHVGRRDCLMQFLAQLACAIFWFHPLAWYGARRMRIERERACDDRVLECGTEPADYADHLLAVVRAMRGQGLALPGAVAFARPSQFEGRLLAVLDARRVRGGLNAARVRRAAAVAALVMIPLALLKPWAGPAVAGFTISNSHRARVEDAPPSEVVDVPASEATLSRKLQWSANQSGARAAKGFWIAYSIPHRMTHDGLLGDSGPIDVGTLGEQWSGPRMADVVADRTTKDPAIVPDRDVIVVTYHFSGRGARPEDVDRIRYQSMKLPADFGRQPLFWLGPVADGESFDWAKRVESVAGGREVRSTALETTALHADENAVRGHLQQVLRGSSATDLRVTATECLQRFSDPGTLQLLNSMARSDRSEDVRQAAVETLGEMDSPESVRILSAMARDSNLSEDIRRSAVEALGEKASDEAKRTLEAMIDGADAQSAASPGKGASQSSKSSKTSKSNMDVQEMPKQEDQEALQRQAVETLGHFPAEATLPKLIKIVQTHPSARVRYQAVETIADLDTDAALKALSDIAWKPNGDEDLAQRAVEGIAQFDQATSKLCDIAKRHPSSAVRQRAVESLGDLEPQSQVLSVLDDLVRSDPDEDVQRRAVESIAQFSESVSLPRLEKIARTHPKIAIRRQAIEALGDVDPAKAAPILESLIKGS